MIGSILSHLKVWLRRRNNPLLRDPLYAELIAKRDLARKRHARCAHLDAELTDYVHQLLKTH